MRAQPILGNQELRHFLWFFNGIFLFFSTIYRMMHPSMSFSLSFVLLSIQTQKRVREMRSRFLKRVFAISEFWHLEHNPGFSRKILRKDILSWSTGATSTRELTNGK